MPFLPTGLRLLARLPRSAASGAGVPRTFCSAATGDGQRPPEHRPPFDPALLDLLVCPLSKKPLRYEESTNELINEELGIAYPITEGIPNMIPQAARMIAKEKQEKEPEQT